jgi:hypothetical protein
MYANLASVQLDSLPRMTVNHDEILNVRARADIIWGRGVRPDYIMKPDEHIVGYDNVSNNERVGAYDGLTANPRQARDRRFSYRRIRRNNLVQRIYPWTVYMHKVQLLS